MSFLHRLRQKMAPGIAAKIALLSWLLALATLFIFVALTVPQQQRNYLDSLKSKANSVAVALHDVAAGAAINDDLASVVSSCQTLLQGDPETSLLVVTRNNGFSLFNQQSGWRVEPQLGDFWLPHERVASGSITKVPLINKELYHYAQPFDYSGIEWGWIHVGLSLERYHKEVHLLHRNTLVLTLACMLGSLLGAIVFSRQIVRPILHVRHIVEQVAGGDLSVKAKTSRRDELGILSRSVNTMIENLIHRNNILETVRFSAQHFTQVQQWEEAVPAVLEKIGRVTKTTHINFFLNQEDPTGALYMSLKHEWTDGKTETRLNASELQRITYKHSGIAHWVDKLRKKQCIFGKVAEFGKLERTTLQTMGVRSVMAIPVFAADQWLGFIGVADCMQERNWTAAEQDSFIAIAEILGSTIVRQQDRSALIDAKEHLEQRVEQRTSELQQQVIAKEKALADLAAAQSSLVQLSRAAGMAEVATGVLHNVGNVLNSVNVSCNLIVDQLAQSRIGNIGKVADLLHQHKDELPQYLSADAHGRQIPDYLISLAPVLAKEQALFSDETRNLRTQIDHIKEIVNMQQNYGQVSGVYESISPQTLVEDTLKLNADALARYAIEIKREYAQLPLIETDKHRVLQILLNLIRNANHACRHNDSGAKIITLRLLAVNQDFVSFQVQDNGIGIAEENMTRIFQHGFTTRRKGHGFGLHSGALAAKELGGTLTAHSEGVGQGALFTLTLPISREVVHAIQQR